MLLSAILDALPLRVGARYPPARVSSLTRSRSVNRVFAAPWKGGEHDQHQYASLSWPANLTSHLARSLLAEQLGISEAQASSQLQQLLLLLPGLPLRLRAMRLQQVSRLVGEVAAVGVVLAQLKGIFPAADVELLVLSDPALILDIYQSDCGLTSLKEEVGELRELLPGVDTDRVVSEHPYIVRDLQQLRQAVEHMQTSMPHLDNHQVLAMAANVHVLSLFRAGNIVPVPWHSPAPMQRPAPQPPAIASMGAGTEGSEEPTLASWATYSLGNLQH